jgi:hypothetical protein
MEKSDGPFTIMEGNNRLASYAFSDRTDLDIIAFIGLSPLRCLNIYQIERDRSFATCLVDSRVHNSNHPLG